MLASCAMRAIRDCRSPRRSLLVGSRCSSAAARGQVRSPGSAAGRSLAIAAAARACAACPRGVARSLPLAALAVWCAVSISWSGLPDRSWDYANRTLVYALFAAVGLWPPARTRALAVGLAVLLGAVIVWSLLGKVLPTCLRLRRRSPSQRACAARSASGTSSRSLGDFALVARLWRCAAVAGTLLAYVGARRAPPHLLARRAR